MQTNIQPTAYKQNIKACTDKVMEILVTNGICFIDYYLFLELNESLQNKMRVLVLFHSDIESRKIFITYTQTTNK
ncbi:MAG: hypothetical protein KGZ97_12130 [Bacteroidetes bacterium]|nr:hypothetical protein [Bacteroidota bacterium]